MSYLRELEDQLKELLYDANLDIDGTKKVISFVKAKVLESYKNGLAATPKSAKQTKKKATK